MRAGVLAALLGLCVLQRAHADPLATTAARAHYDAGRTYFEQGDLRRALTEFQAAQRDDDRPELDYDLALTYERLGDAARAADHLRRFLVRAGGVPERAELETRIATLEARTGELEALSRTPGAALHVDGEPLPPSGRLRLTAGAHHVEATKEGTYGRGVAVQIEAGRLTRIELDPILPSDPQRARRRALAIGLGVAGGAVVVGTAIALGIVFGVGHPDPFVGNAGVLFVKP